MNYGISPDEIIQRQTLVPPTSDFYAGYDRLDWHPADDMPRVSLDERFGSFSRRLASARERHGLS